MSTTTTGLATSFIQFSRTSNATVTGADGKIKWAGHNLLTNSESFDASAWTKGANVTLSANAAVSPNGTTTADQYSTSSGGDISANGILQSVSTGVCSLTAGILMRASSSQTVQLRLLDGSTQIGNVSCSVTSSWTLFTVTGSPTVGSATFVVLRPDGTNAISNLEIWGAHLYRSDLGGMVLNPARGDAYYPTTPRNLLGFTESLTTGWTNTNTTDSIVTETNPNGLANSVEVTATAGNGTLLGSLSLLASPYTFSIWLKRKTGTGTVEITVDGTTYVTAAVTSDWQRFSTTLTPSAGTRTPGIRIVTSGDAVYAWGAQLSDSASLDAYSPVYGAAVTSAAYYAPRLDYDANGSALGLLVEEQRTNLLLRSAEFDNASWSKTAYGTGSAPVVTANAATAPDGTLTADQINLNAGAGTTSSDLSLLRQITTVASATAYSGSLYVKAATAGDIGKTIGFRHVANSSYTVVTLTSTWTRISLAETSISTTGNFDIACRGGLTSASASVLVWGAQLEAGSFATSYIPTGASTATRTADVASVSTQAFPYNASEGALVAAFTPINVAAARRAAQIDDGTANERITLGTDSTPNGLITVIDGGSSQASIATGTPSANTTMKLAARYKVNDFAVSANGAAVATDTSGTLPTMNTLRLASGVSSAEPLNGWLRQITYLPRALTDAELAARSA